MHLEVITGVSIFNPSAPIVGLALPGEINTINLCRKADQFQCGRPAATQTLNGRPQAEQIAYLVGQWVLWATRNNIPLTISTTPRWACAF